METLPNTISAHWFVCQCFGVTTEDIAPINRETLRRACVEKSITPSKVSEVGGILREALFSKFRRQGIAPAGVATGVADKAVCALLKIYEELRPRMQLGEASPTDVLWVMSKHVFLPTLHVIFAQAKNGGLGSEYFNKSCWYLPQRDGDRLCRPVAVLLDRWLRAAGFRTAYGVAKPDNASMATRDYKKWKSVQKQVGRWRKSKTAPHVSKLHELVRLFPENVEWLDSAESWSARFSLASATGQALAAADKFFVSKSATPAETLTEKYQALGEEPFLVDDQNFLVNPYRYFAVRLWIMELKDSGEFERIRDAVPKSSSLSFPGEVTDHEIQQAADRATREMNLGNHLWRHLLLVTRQSEVCGNWSAYLERDEILDDFLFEVAAKKLNSPLLSSE